MKRKLKRFLATLMVGALVCSNFPANAVNAVFAAGETGTQVQEVFSAEFADEYAKVGEALKVNVTGTDEVTYRWYVDGKQITNTSDSYTPSENDLEKWIEVVVTSGDEQVSAKLYCSKLPVVYIETENGAAITSKEDYINATLKIQGNETYNSETTTLYDGVIEIRGRGNSTWSKPKKPYKIKLDKKTSVFGMGKNKHWVLLANYLDESLMRNTLAYDLSGSMDMNQMSTVWVDVVMNGEYIGNYQFCEQVRVDEERVDIFDWEGLAEDAAEIIADAEGLSKDLADDLATYMLEENMGWITSKEVTFNGKTYNIADYPDIEIPSIDGGYLLELDEYYDEVSKFKTNSNQPIMFKNPEFVKTNSDMVNYVKTYVQAFEDAVRSTEYTARYEGEMVHYSELYDFESLVDYWLISEIFYNEELNKKSTYMHKEVGEPMKMGPIWDMDWSSGAAGTSATATDQWATLRFSVNAQSEQWYKYLVQDPYFLTKVQERYWEIRDVQVQDMLDAIDGYYDYLKESGAADGIRWAGRKSFADDARELQNWLNTHIAWMDAQLSTKKSINASFYNAQENLKLVLKDAEGKEYALDAATTVPADFMIEDGTNVTLSVTGNSTVKGTAQIFVNGQKYTTVSVDTTAKEVQISADALTGAPGEKNTIEAKIVNTSGTVTSANYITVKEYAAGELPEAAEFGVSFNSEYAKVGKTLLAQVTGAVDVSYRWYVNGKQISNTTNAYTPTVSDLESWIEVVATTGTKSVSTKLYFSKLPVVYIDTENGAAITSKEDYINATLRIQGNEIYNSETTTLYDGITEIRGRGNSTWSQPKKPYKLKLDKKTSVFGMGKNKHWVLLANYLDESLMRNTLAYDLSGSMDMNQMSTVWVDVIMNGEYIGNYQFCEQVRVDEERVDVFDWEGLAEDAAGVIADAEGLSKDLAGDLEEYMLEENMGWITSGKVTFNGKTYNIADYPDIQVPDIDGGYLLELDEYYDEASVFRTDSNQPMMFKNPEFVKTNADMMNYVKTYVQAFEDAVRSDDYMAVYDGKTTHYSELYDLESLIDYWLINEIFFNEELNKKSTYMYKDNGELMKMGPIWDMDWSSGASGTGAGAANQWATAYFNANAQSEQWYKYLMSDPYFRAKVQERYWEIRDVQVKEMLDSIDEHYEYLKESGAADGVRWPNRVSFANDATNLKNWLNTHIAWMDQQMTSEDSLDGVFYVKDSTVELVLVDENEEVLQQDGAAKGAADYMTEEGTALTLIIRGNVNLKGNADIYVNSQKISSVTLNGSDVEVMIPADALEAIGQKNSIEVKVAGAENYVTVREYPEGELPEKPVVPIDPSDDSKDYPVSKLTYSTGSDSPAGEGLENAFDGNVNSIWHTEYRPAWYGSENCENYLWVEMLFEEETVVEAIRYLPRQDNTVNGHILGYRVEGTIDGKTWTTLTTGAWTYDDKGWKVAEFDAIALTGLRLVATSSDSGSSKDRYASAAEIRVRTGELPNDQDKPDKPDVPDVPSNPSDSSKDYDVTKITYKAGSEQAQEYQGGTIEFAFDDDKATHWHTEWKPAWYGVENPEKYLWVEFEFEEAIVADAIRYLPRQDDSNNGIIVKYRVDGTVDGVTWVKLADGAWSEEDRDWKIAEFDAIEVKGLRLVATDTVSSEGKNKFASAAELRVRQGTLETVVVVDKTALATAIASAEALNEDVYTVESWAVFEEALNAALTVNVDDAATQEAVDKALADLAAAQEALEGKPAPVVNPFEDVKEADYYYAPVLWAVENGITTGTSATTFSPEDTCTRGAVVTFLWRAAGCPEPEAKEAAFVDVAEADYYYKAVLWAVEQGITTGTSATTFAPNEGCTRGQVVTFLFRAADEEVPADAENTFTDVVEGAYYEDAVLWAVANGITTGTSETTFEPNTSCTRGQIVTFLYRYYN